MASVLTEMQRRRPPGYIYRHTQPLRDVSPPREPQPVRVQRESDSDDSTSSDGSSSEEDVERVEDEVRSIHWFPYDRVGVVNADP
jgi:hypothetical protein